MPEISIIIPVYNTEQFLGNCLDSVLAQTFADFEVIAVDDGSTDDSTTLLEQFAQKDNRILVIHQKNKGLSEARNAGLARVRGNWVTFVDSDDILAPIFLQSLFNAVNATKADIACCGKRSFKELSEIPIASSKAQNHITLIPTEALTNALYQNDRPDYSAWNKLYAARLWKERRFPAGAFFEDLATLPQIFLDASTIVFVPMPLYFYRKHSSSILSTAYSCKKAELLDIAEKVCVLVHGKSKKLETAALCNLFSASCSILMRTPDTEEFRSFRKRAWKHIKETRVTTLFNAKSRTRNKIAALCSFGGKSFFESVLRRFG